MKKFISILLALVFSLSVATPIFAESGTKYAAEAQNSFYSDANITFDYQVTGAYLCEAKTGKVLYATNEFKAASPASVTKIGYDAFANCSSIETLTLPFNVNPLTLSK